MSSLDKLGIRGIRSFDDKEFNVIQFYHPLTVIVGHNGSGKTTIIECLKYITTGDMPPNTKGGAFVHDPNMAGETEVKAEVKLRFVNTNNDKMTANRRLQVTKKKTALSLKTLEGTLAFTNEEQDNSKRRALSTRCSDLDEEIPRLLGVSKAILENVIFCHQEDSNWPLSEPGLLKKKFDDIFEATKYTKALDQLKSIRKEQTQETKVDRERLLALKIDRERATKIQGTITKLEKDIGHKTAEEERLVEDIKAVTEHNRRFYELAVEHTRVYNEVRNLEVEKSEKKKTIDSLRATMSELPGTREELESRKRNFAREAADKRSAKQGFANELDTAEDEHHRLSGQQSKLVATRGGLEAEQKAFERALDNRESLVKTLALQHDIRGFDIEALEESQIADFRERLQSSQQKARREWDEVKETNRKMEDERRGAISSITSEQQSNRTIRLDVKTQQDRVKQNIDEVIVQIEESSGSETDILTQRQRKEEAEVRLATASEELKKSAVDDAVTAKGKELRKLEEQRDELHTEIAGLNTQADTRAKLALKRADATKKDELMQSILDNNIDGYRKHAQKVLDKSKMLDTVKAAINRMTSELSRTEKAAAVAQRELNQIESSISLLKQQKSAAEKEASDNEIAVAEATDGQALDAAIEEAEAEIHNREREIEQLNSAAAFFQRVLEHGKTKEICIACSRGLSRRELPAFEDYCRNQIATNPKQLQDLESDLPDWQNQLTLFRKLQPRAERAAKLRAEDIPKFESELQRVNSKHADAAAKAEETSQKISELKTASRELDSLRSAAADIQRLIQESSDLKRDIDVLEAQLQSSGSTRTADDVQGEIQTLNQAMSQIKKDLERLSRDKERLTGQIRASETEISRAQLRLQQAEQKASVRARAIADKQKLEDERQSLQERLEVIDRRLKESEPTILKLRKDFKTLQDTHRERESQCQAAVDALSKDLDQLRTAMKAVEDARKQDIKSKLKSVEARIRDAEGELRVHTDRMATLREQIAALEKEEANSKQMERNVDDNIRFRLLKEEVKDIELNIASKDLEGANKAKARFDQDYEQGRKRLQSLQAQQAKITGELAMAKSTLEERRAEIESEYKDVVKLYTKQLIKVKTAEFAIQDLEKYGRALDSAIMKYHGHKMMEINDTAQALWTKCYQGTDIDTIMIKSDHEGTSKVGNRSYNYRVVMVKDSVELDMRGRCSAGQKVLASIIIRLALAESFGTNCGILALDEPTTNLDRDNIMALAEALSDIIQERKAQSNFQLIVITHDEEFLSALGASGAVDKYWRVSRNNRQKSQIERQRLDQH